MNYQMKNHELVGAFMNAIPALLKTQLRVSTTELLTTESLPGIEFFKVHSVKSMREV